jgi:hypothetical protein
VSGKAENDAVAFSSGPATADPESAIGKVSAQARQAGADAAALAGKVVDDARARPRRGEQAESSVAETTRSPSADRPRPGSPARS